MKKQLLSAALVATLLSACGGSSKNAPAETEKFSYTVEQFADLQILRYRVPGFEALSLDQKKLVYYLTEAALQGRDILFDQNGKYNLVIRKMLEAVYTGYTGDKTSADFKAMTVSITIMAARSSCPASLPNFSSKPCWAWMCPRCPWQRDKPWSSCARKSSPSSSTPR